MTAKEFYNKNKDRVVRLKNSTDVPVRERGKEYEVVGYKSWCNAVICEWKLERNSFPPESLELVE